MTFLKLNRSDSKSAVAFPTVTKMVRKRRSMSAPPPKGMEQRQVRFDDKPPNVSEIDHVQPEEEDSVWFPMDYLQACRKEEIKNNLRAQYYTRAASSKLPTNIESDVLTWRGMEDIREQYNRQDKSSGHVQAVLKKYKAQKNASSKSSQQALRQYARTLSKADRQRAVKLGAYDAKFATGKKATPVRSKSLEFVLGKHLTDSLRSWSPGQNNKQQQQRSWKSNNTMSGFNWRLSTSHHGSGSELLSTRTVASDDHYEEEDHHDTQ